MQHRKKLITLAFIAITIMACRKDIRPDGKDLAEDAAATESGRHSGNDGGDKGHVYTLSNEAGGNKVLDYRRSVDGSLTLVNSYPTGGKGSGGGLGNQGAVILTDENKFLLAINAGSNSISSFKITPDGLRLVSEIYSRGVKPISITSHEDLVFVLNAGGEGNIAGFWLTDNGRLFPVPYARRPLSSSASDPAQISFVNNGKVLAVTEKATQKIITYTVSEHGFPGVFHSITSANTTPFGFAAGRNGNIYVSEAGGGAPGASTLSSYHINFNGTISLTKGPVSASQTAACWVVLTDDNKYAFATNTGSNNISSFGVNFFSGNIDVVNAVASTSGMGPIDADLSTNSRFLFVLNAGSHTITSYKVDGGNLSSLQTINDLPMAATGMAAD